MAGGKTCDKKKSAKDMPPKAMKKQMGKDMKPMEKSGPMMSPADSLMEIAKRRAG